MELLKNTPLQNGKYKIIEKIGQGGFGIAYKAKQVSLDKIVCIKEFYFSDLCERKPNSSYITIISTSSEKIQLVNSLKKKFIKEALRLAKFQHPNIVQVTDNFEENNTAYFVMEFLDGGSLDDLIRKDGAMSEQKAKALILPIIDAMDAVHKMDLLHLDIKPANIMLRKNQSPVLIDFGISKYLETANGNTTTAPIGISKGFAPLEQYGGSITDFSKATDVYSLCATIYNMVTGITPPEPLQMLTNGFKSPRDLRPQLTPDFNAAILKGLSTKAVDRQQSMAQLETVFGETKKAAQTDTQTVIQNVEPILTTAVEFFNRAEKKRKNKEYEAAIKDYNEAIKKNAKNYDYYFFRGLCYHELENYNDAIKDYSKVIELNPKEDASFYNRGLCYSQLEKYEAASKDFFKAFELEQKDTYFNQWFEMARKSVDLETINKYISNGKWLNKDKVYFTRGEIYLTKGEYIKASDDFYQAYLISKNAEYLNSWKKYDNINMLNNYLERDLPFKDEVELRIALNHLANDNRPDFRKSLRNSKKLGNSTAAKIINLMLIDYLLLFFILIFDLISVYCFTEIIQKKIFYSNDEIFNIPIAIFWLCFVLGWSIPAIYAVKNKVTLINSKWVRIFKKAHLFPLGLIASGFSGYLIYMWVTDTHFSTIELGNLVGMVFGTIVTLCFCLYSFFWFFIAISGENDRGWVLLDLINDDYSYTAPFRMLEEFQK